MVAHEGALPAIVAAMGAHGEDEQVQAIGCTALASITSGTIHVVRRKAVDAGALPQIVAAMLAHDEDAAMQIAACSALTNICSLKGGFKSNKSKVILVPGLAYIELAKSLVLWERPGNSGLYVSCTGTEAPDDELQRLVARARALPAIVNAMAKHTNGAGVLREACDALTAITMGADSEAEERRREASRVGALPLIVAAMHAFKQDAALQQGACIALLSIVIRSKERGHTAERAGAHDAINAAMSTHANDGDMQTFGEMTKLELKRW
jgi:hypothetical protein